MPEVLIRYSRVDEHMKVQKSTWKLPRYAHLKRLASLVSEQLSYKARVVLIKR